MHLSCQQCDTPILAGDMNLEHAIAKCSHCGFVFSFAEVLGSATGSIAHLQEAIRQGWKPHQDPVALPAGMTIKTMAGSVRITQRWFEKLAFLSLVSCLLWYAPLYLWFTELYYPGLDFSLKMITTLYAGGGVFFAYFTLARFVNSTVIQADRRFLTVRQRPLPWFGKRNIPVPDVKQIYCVESVRHNSLGHRHASYQVRAILHSGATIGLTSGLKHPEQAFFIEDQLEKGLGIPPRKVQGELRRP